MENTSCNLFYRWQKEVPMKTFVKKETILTWLVVLFAGFMFILPGCGGDSGGSRTVQPTGETQQDINDVVEHLTSTLGEDGGFDAVILAMDKGYSLDQILDAIMDERLDLNGDIADAAGVIEAPEEPPSSIILSSSVVFKEINSPIELDDIRLGSKRMESILDMKKELILLNLKGLGYELDQIAEGILLNLVRLRIYFGPDGSSYYVCVILSPGVYPDFTGQWHSEVPCDNYFYPWQWEINLVTNQSLRTVTGYIHFHACPGGGQLSYAVSGTWEMAISDPKGKRARHTIFGALFKDISIMDLEYVELYPELINGIGPLYENPPIIFKFYIRLYEDPIPNVLNFKNV